jgi:hypothetical protein
MRLHTGGKIRFWVGRDLGSGVRRYIAETAADVASPGLYDKRILVVARWAEGQQHWEVQVNGEVVPVTQTSDATSDPDSATRVVVGHAGSGTGPTWRFTAGYILTRQLTDAECVQLVATYQTRLDAASGG